MNTTRTEAKDLFRFIRATSTSVLTAVGWKKIADLRLGDVLVEKPTLFTEFEDEEEGY